MPMGMRHFGLKVPYSDQANGKGLSRLLLGILAI